MALVPALVAAQSADELKRYEELDRKCEQARYRKLAPIRVAKIDRCVKVEGRARADCAGEFSVYGNTHGTAGGGAVGGLFYDLPECVTAFEARGRYRQ